MSLSSAGKHLLAVAAAVLIASTAAAQPETEQGATLQSVTEEGRALLEQGDYAGALAAAERVTANDRTYAQAYVLKGDALKALENYVEAAAAYKQATDLNGSLVDAFIGRGESLLETGESGAPGDLEFARDAFRKALDLDRDNPATLSSLGHVEVLYGNGTEAIRLLSQAVELDPTNSRSYRDLALAHAQLREFDESLQNLQKAVEADPNDYENYAIMGSVRRIEEDFQGEVEAITKAIETYKPKNRTDPDVFLNGYLQRTDARIRWANELDEDDAEQRRELYQQVIEDADAVLALAEDQYPENGLAYYWRGRAQRLLEDYSAAINSFTRAIQAYVPGETDTYLSSAYLYRGICWFYQDSLDLARLDFIEAKSIGAGFDDPRIHLWIGFTYHKEEKFRQAIDSYGEASARNPAFALAHVNQGLAYVMLEEYQKAVESFNKAIRAEPLEPEHFYKVGLAQLKLGEFQKAIYAFDNALQIDAENAKYHDAMARALRGNGEESLAGTYQQRADELRPQEN